MAGGHRGPRDTEATSNPVGSPTSPARGAVVRPAALRACHRPVEASHPGTGRSSCGNARSPPRESPRTGCDLEGKSGKPPSRGSADVRTEVRGLAGPLRPSPCLGQAPECVTRFRCYLKTALCRRRGRLPSGDAVSGATKVHDSDLSTDFSRSVSGPGAAQAGGHGEIFQTLLRKPGWSLSTLPAP